MLSHKPWQIESVIQLVAGVFVCLCTGVVMAGLLRQAGVAGFKTADSFGGVLLGTLSFQGAAWVLILFFLRQHEVRWRDAFGFSNANLKKSLLFAGLLLIPALLVVLGLQHLSALALQKHGWPVEDQRAIELIVRSKSLWQRGYFVLFAVVLVPVAEEFIFRGVLYPMVKQWGRPRLALVGVSLLFALIHFDLPTFLPLFALALALTWLYEQTDCLLAPITTHSLFNAANLVILFTQHK